MKTTNKDNRVLLGSIVSFFLLSNVGHAQPASITKISDSSTTFAATSDDGLEMPLSSDGRYVAVIQQDGSSPSLVYRYDRTGNPRTLVSQSSGGVAANGSASSSPVMSADGRFVAFKSSASNLVAGDTNSSPDIFLRDIQNETTVALTDITDTDDEYSNLVIAADGSAVFYRIDIDDLEDYEIKKYDVVGTSTSTITAPAGDVPLDASSDGSYLLVFRAPAVSGQGPAGIYRLDLSNNSSVQVDVNNDGDAGDASAQSGRMSDNGRYVAFSSSATNLVSGDTNSRADIYVRDLTSATTTRVSVRSDGAQSANNCSDPDISSEGRFITFVCNSLQLVYGDSNDVSDIYLYDRTTTGIKELSSTVSGTQGNLPSYTSTISGDGAYVTFLSDASNLVSGDTNSSIDQFLVGTGSSVTLDQCILDVAKTEAGSCGCGFLDTDSDANGNADCLDPDGNTIPAAPTVKVVRKKITVSVSALPEPNAQLIVYAEKGRVLIRERAAVGNMKKSFTLTKGRYRVSVRFKRPSGIVTQESAQVSARIR